MRHETAGACARTMAGAAAVPAATATAAFFRNERRFTRPPRFAFPFSKNKTPLWRGLVFADASRRYSVANTQPFLPLAFCAILWVATMKLSERFSAMENHCTESARNFFQGSQPFLNFAF